jgi:hypothetical protein
MFLFIIEPRYLKQLLLGKFLRVNHMSLFLSFDGSDFVHDFELSNYIEEMQTHNISKIID